MGPAEIFDWDKNIYGSIDLRLFYTDLPADAWSRCRWDPNDESIPKFWRISSITNT